MTAYLTTHPFAKIGVFALLLIPFLLLINAFSPPPELLPESYSSTILALEFVTSPEEVKAILNPLSVEQVKDLDTINYIDFGFMLFYSVFLLLFVLKLRSFDQRYWVRYLWIMPVAIFIFDLLENIQLLQITALYVGTVHEQEWLAPIWRLQLFTWLKWGGLALCMVAIAASIMRMYSMTRLIFASLLSVPFLMLVVTSAAKSVTTRDAFASSVFFAFFVLVVYCFIIKQSNSHEINVLYESNQ